MTKRRPKGTLARLERRATEQGVLSLLSEGAFQLARRLARGPEDSAHPIHAVRRAKLKQKATSLASKLVELRGKFAELREKAEEQRKALVALRGSLREAERRIRQLTAAEKAARREVTRVTKRLRRSKSGALFAFEASTVGPRSCFVCGGTNLHVLPYPYAAVPPFSRLIVLVCSGCGFGWVPAIPFDLDEYYRTEYGVSNRADRDLPPEAYFALESDAPHPGGPALERYFARSRFHLELVRSRMPSIGTVLDFGAGPGCALFLSGAAKKHAIEPDQQSQKYLDHIGAVRLTLTDLEPGAYDLVLSSHSLEHLPAHELFPTLAVLRKSLREGGLLCVEVPVASLGETYLPVRHEPHTLFFSPEALERVLVLAGFTVLERRFRLPARRQVLTRPLRPPSTDREYSTAHDGLVILATPGGPAQAMPTVPASSANVLEPP